MYLEEIGLRANAYAAPIGTARGIGFNENELVTPASVMKIQVALTIENLIARGRIDGTEVRTVPRGTRTPGPTGMSLMHDEVRISVRDLVVAMMTISDNVATDELISLGGLDAVNRTTRELGLVSTLITSDLNQMLADVGREAGFDDYEQLAAHDPKVDGAPSAEEIMRRIRQSRALNPTQGTRTTAFEVVTMLQAIWTDRAGDAVACRNVRQVMGRQLTRNRIASGFGGAVTVAAKSGALIGVVRNEAGVVTLPDGEAYAVAVFTRALDDSRVDPAVIDDAIGRVARSLIDELQ